MDDTIPLALQSEKTDEEVAAILTAEEGRPVSLHEVRRIEARALRKLRRALLARGMTYENLSTG